MTAAWYLRARQYLATVQWWVSITGYDHDDKSFNNRAYLLYLVLFFGVWGLAVLGLVTSAAAQGLLLLAPDSPVALSAELAVAALLAWWLWSLWGAARRSPLSLTPEDAVLVCLTPIPRPAVVFAWLAGAWFTSGVFFWGLAVMLGFAQAEIITGGKDFWRDLHLYLAAGIRFLLPVAVAQFGMLAAAWGLGALRLQGGRVLRGLAWLPLGLALLLVLNLIFPELQMYLGWLALPIRLPVLAGAGLGSSLAGWAAALSLAGLGTLGLGLAARRFNLSRAAQETKKTSTLAAATLLGDRQLMDSIKLKQRLRSGGRTSLAALPGARVLIWKAVVRAMRGLSAGAIFDWVLIFLLTLGAALAPDWGSRVIALLFWAARLNERLTEELRADLNQWGIFQSLPLRVRPRLLAEMAPTAGLVLLVGWLGLLTANLTGLSAAGWEIALLLPFAVVSAAYAGMYDTLRQAKSDHLLAGSVPAPGFVAVLLTGLSLALLVGLVVFFRVSLFGVLPALLAGILAAAVLVSMAERSFRRLGR